MNRVFVSTVLFVSLLGSGFMIACTKQDAANAGAETTVGKEAAAKLLASIPLRRAADLVPTRNDAMRLALRGDHLVASAIHDGDRHKLRAEVDLPLEARSAFRLAKEGLHGAFAIAVQAQGTEAVHGQDREGILHYPNAYGPGTELTQVATLAGTEDYVTLDADTRNELTYRVDIADGVAGLRLVSNTLEFLDTEGTPQLRVAPPYGVDANGKRFPAVLSVKGCAADTNPAAPWGRAITPPGARTCVIQTSWRSEGLAFPIVVDPAWTATQDMSASSITWELPLVVLSGGKVLAVPGGTAAQIFDPATNTWAATGAPPMYFGHRTRMVAVGGNQAWATGGIDFGQMQKTARYDLAAGTWTATADTPNPAGNTDGKALAYVGNDNVLLFDSSGTVHAYNVANDNYTAKTSFAGYLGYNTGAWLVGGSVYIQGGAATFIRTYSVANDTWTSSNDVQPFLPDNNTGQIEPLANGKFLTWGKGNYAYLWDPGTDSSSQIAVPGGAPDVGYLCFRSSQVTFGGGKKHLIGAGRFTYDEDANTITDNGDASVNVHSVIVKLQDGRFLAAGQANIQGQSNKVDFFSPSSQADCDGDFANPLTPVYHAGTNACVACANDNGGAAPACPQATKPACLTVGANKGACVECGPGKLAACSSPTKPACDAAANKCAGANGDFGTAATIPCPTAANPYQRADGSCGKCTSNADCAGANHGGAICAVATGACGTSCASDAECGTGKYCDVSGTKTCLVVKTDGAPCGRKEECATGTCTAGTCGKGVSPGDAGADSGKPTTDGGSSSSSTGGLDSGASTGDAGTSSSTSSSGSVPNDGSSGGCGCHASSTAGTLSNGLVGAMAAVALAFLRRRRSDDESQS